MVRFLFVLMISLAAAHAGAQAPAARAPAPDPAALLAAAKAASGGAAWDAMRTQHSTVKLAAANLEGTVQRWSDIATGQSVLRYSIGPLTGAAGFDGKSVWTQDGTDAAKVETAAPALELAANAAFRDRLAFWYPDRAKARIAYKERAEADGRKFDVVTIVPEGGRAFEFWIGADSRLIERLVEREADVTRTEIYSDRRDVQGVKIPFLVRTTRGDPKMDEVVNVQKIAFNEPLTDVAFGPPAARPEFTFPAGRASVDVDFEVFSGHTFVRVMLDGRGPFRMLFDAGGANVLAAETAALLVGKGNPVPRTLAVGTTNLAGVELGDQRYVVADVDAFLRRVEGLDDVAGIVGLEWFVRMPIKVDHARSRLTLFDPAQFKGAGAGTRVPVAARGRLPQLRGSLDGFDGMFEIDMGSRGSLTLAPAFAAKHDLAAKLSAKNEAITGAGMAGPMRALLARGKMLKLGAVEVPYPGDRDPARHQGRARGVGDRRQRRLRRAAAIRDHLRPPERCPLLRALSQLRHAGHRRSRRPLARARRRRLRGHRRGGRGAGGAGGAQGRRRDRRDQRPRVGGRFAAGAARRAARARRLARARQDGRRDRGDAGAARPRLTADVRAAVVPRRGRAARPMPPAARRVRGTAARAAATLPVRARSGCAACPDG